MPPPRGWARASREASEENLIAADSPGQPARREMDEGCTDACTHTDAVARTVVSQISHTHRGGSK